MTYFPKIGDPYLTYLMPSAILLHKFIRKTISRMDLIELTLLSDWLQCDILHVKSLYGTETTQLRTQVKPPLDRNNNLENLNGFAVLWRNCLTVYTQNLFLIFRTAYSVGNSKISLGSLKWFSVLHHHRRRLLTAASHLDWQCCLSLLIAWNALDRAAEGRLQYEWTHLYIIWMHTEWEIGAQAMHNIIHSYSLMRTAKS